MRGRPAAPCLLWGAVKRLLFSVHVGRLPKEAFQEITALDQYLAMGGLYIIGMLDNFLCLG
jgi:hypothetical protein